MLCQNPSLFTLSPPLPSNRSQHDLCSGSEAQRPYEAAQHHVRTRLCSAGLCSALALLCSALLPVRPLQWLTIFRSNGDYDMANTAEVRKYLKTYGLTPPAVESHEVQAQRCEYCQCGSSDRL